MVNTKLARELGDRPESKRLEAALLNLNLSQKTRAAKLAMVGRRCTEFFWVPADGSMRAIPNSFARSNIFGKAVKDGETMLEGERLVSYENISLVYWGEWLTEVHEEAWMQLMYEARYATSWQRVEVKAARFLAALGKSTGGGQYDQLAEVLNTLANARFTIQVSSKGFLNDVTAEGPLHFVSNLEYSKGQRVFSFQIDPRWTALFSNDEYVRIDWQARLAFGRNQAMAKALQSYVGSFSKGTQRRKVEWLMRKLRYRGPTRKFKEAFQRAIAVLEKANVASGARFDKARCGSLMAVWDRL